MFGPNAQRSPDWPNISHEYKNSNAHNDVPALIQQPQFPKILCYKYKTRNSDNATAAYSDISIKWYSMLYFAMFLWYLALYHLLYKFYNILMYVHTNENQNVKYSHCLRSDSYCTVQIMSLHIVYASRH